MLASDIKYALHVADIIHLTATRDTIIKVNQMAGIIDLINGYSRKKIYIDLTI
jgi:hypothetical protein